MGAVVYTKMEKLSYWHWPGIEPLSPLTVGQLIDIAAEKWGDREAVISVYQGHRFTYSEVRVKVDKLAAGLLNLGLSPGNRLGIWGLNSSEVYISYLAAAKAGLIAVMINPAYQAPELLQCLRKAEVKTLICAEDCGCGSCYNIMLQLIPELNNCLKPEIQFRSADLPELTNVIIISEKKFPGTRRFMDISINATSESLKQVCQLKTLIQPDDGSTILFTSGTTGHPKGALLSHHNVVNNALASGRRLILSSQLHRWCLCTQFCHASAICVSLMNCLCYGATLVIPKSAFHPLETLKTIQQERCTILLASPTLYIDMMTAMHEHGITLDSLVVACIGTAPISQQLIHDMFGTLRIQRINVMYGMTETSPLLFQSLFTDTVHQTATTVGTLVEHMEAKVVDSDGKIVAMRTPGELYVRGYATMLGYWGQEDKTQEIMTPDGWLKTGDQFVLQENGYGKVVGRLKEMIIRDNTNIFPLEIEEFLTSHPDVLEVQAFGIPDQRLGEELCAYIRHSEEIILTEEKVRNFCKGKLADFLIPRYFRFTTLFPRTTTGKVDKLQLRNSVLKELHINEC